MALLNPLDSSTQHAPHIRCSDIFLVLVQARCQAPAKLVLQQPSLQPVQLKAAKAGCAHNSASVAVPIANQGNISLAVAFSLERRNTSVLVPDQWLDPSSSYQQLFSGSQGSCSSGQVCCRASPSAKLMPCIFSQLQESTRCTCRLCWCLYDSTSICRTGSVALR